MNGYFKEKMFQTVMLLCMVMLVIPSSAQKGKQKNTPQSEYMVLASVDVQHDPAWMQVVNALQKKHGGQVVFYKEAPREALASLQKERPRYVAVVEKPEHLDRYYVIDMNRVSREVDDDIYADFLWGIITGYDAREALKMVNNSTEPLVVKDAVATIMELNSGKWFDRYAWVDDHKMGLWGEKKGKGKAVETYHIEMQEVLPKFVDLYGSYDPDLVVTAAHATEMNLEMPFSLGNILSKNGVLYAQTKDKKELDLKQDGKRKVYFAVGNCLIGSVNKTKESMAIAWMKSGNAAAMIGYVVESWYGRNGWGGLKYWVTNPGRYSLPEAMYMNQQDMLFQLNEWNPILARDKFPFQPNSMSSLPVAKLTFFNQGFGELTKDQLGFWYDRDPVAYYGDPKWDVRLQEVPGETDFTVTSEMKGRKYTVTIKTNENFSLDRMIGDKFKEEHVLDLPFSYFFPQRLNNPRLAEGQKVKAAVDENFLLVYNPDFKPNMTYKIVLDVDK